MATVRDYVRAYLPGTYEKLVVEGSLDGDTLPDAVGMAIANAEETLLTPDTDVNELSEFARRYLAAVAVLLVIPSAIDYYMVKTRLSDGASRPSGVTPLGGENSRNYDRVASLKEIETRLSAWVAKMNTRFLDEVGDEAYAPTTLLSSNPGIAVSGSGKMLTLDPDLFVKPSVPEVLRTRFGILVQSV